MCFRIHPGVKLTKPVKQKKSLIREKSALKCFNCGTEIGAILDLTIGEYSCICGRKFSPDIEVDENIDDI
jgi:hypothetical protein